VGREAEVTVEDAFATVLAQDGTNRKSATLSGGRCHEM
jgi:hypothetical protein